MIINDLDGYYIVFDTKNWNTELDTLPICTIIYIEKYYLLYPISILPTFVCINAQERHQEIHITESVSMKGNKTT